MSEYEFHPVANIFPMMTEEEYAALRDDIAENGLLEPIWFYDSKIIDGRNRYRACKELGIEPTKKFWSNQAGASLTAFVISLNLHRRNLTPGQKAAVGVASLPFFEDEARKNQEASRAKAGEKVGSKASQKIDSPRKANEQRATAQAAKATGTNRQYVTDAAKLQKEAPEIFEEVKKGNINIPAGKEIAALPEAERKAVVEAGPEAIKAKAKEIKSEREKSIPEAHFENFQGWWDGLSKSERKAIHRFVVESEGWGPATRRGVADFIRASIE